MSGATDPRSIEIEAELDRLTPLDGRSPQTTPEEEAAAFAELSAFRDGAVFTGSFSGRSPWERHPGGDELVQIVRGSTRLTILMDDGPRELELDAGTFTVVPRGRWHRFHSERGVSVLTVTPLPTEHTDGETPPARPADTEGRS